MPNVFKRNELAEMPAGAIVEEKDGKRIARWTEGAKTRKAEVTTTRTGEKIIIGQSDTWSGKLQIGKRPHHTWKVVSLFTDKTASERELAKMQAVEDQRAAGVVTVEMQQAGRPLSEHAADYLAALKLAGVDDAHHRIASWMLGRLIELAGWKRIGDVTADSLRVVLTRLAADGYATNYINKFTSRGKAFIHWMQQNGRMTADPLAGVRRSNAAKGKRTRSRRAMTHEELADLLAAAPVDRRRKYLFAALSGLRRGELADLRWSDLKLNAPIPFIQLREDQTKNAKADAIPLHPALVRVLGELPAPTTDDTRVFGVIPDMKTMARDLLKAGLATETTDPSAGVRLDKGRYVIISDARGRRTDFHALRHTFKTAVDRTGCTEATSDALTRHGDKTVGDGYRHAELADMAEALAKIPDPSPVQEQAQAAATGTTGAAATIPEDPRTRQGTETKSGQTGHSALAIHGAPSSDARTTGRTMARAMEGKTRRQSATTMPVRRENPTPCHGAQVKYNATVGDVRQAQARICDKSLSDKNLRPSTQVD